jgi:hypothetical protein
MFTKISKVNVIVVFVVLVFFWFKGSVALDPDFGWHLKTGQMILEGNFPHYEPFSYTMPRYKYVSHEWLTDTFIATVYPIIGHTGLALLFAIIAVFALIIANISLKKTFWAVPFLLSATGISQFVGVRPQVFTWLFLAILINLLFNGKLRSRNYLSVFLFLLWSNMHGAVAAGIFLMVGVYLWRWIQNRNVDFREFTTLACCVIVTFINPAGYHLWAEMLTQFGDASLYRDTINEWKNSILFIDIGIIGFISFYLIGLYKYKSKVGDEGTIISLVVLYQGLMSARHIPLFLIISSRYITKSINLFNEQIKTDLIARRRFVMAYNFLVFLLLTVFVLESSIIIYKLRQFNEYYPKNAISYLREHPSNGEVFSIYNWGGYLIWKYPEKRVFVDGRMPSFKHGSNTSTTTDWAFRDYIDITKGNSGYKDYFKKYNIDTVLWEKPRKNPSEFRINYRITKSKDNALSIVGRIEKDGWKKIYEDEVAVVWRKN